MRVNLNSITISAGIVMLFVMGLTPPTTANPEAAQANERPFAVEHEMFGMRGTGEGYFGHVGVTGLVLRIHPDSILKVEEIVPETPAAGKFNEGDVIVGVNGITLAGNSPFIVLGSSLTKAEASDGKLVFDVLDAETEQARKVTVEIPVLGAYSETWPLDCEKSAAIIARAAEFYAARNNYVHGGADDEKTPERMVSHGMGGALASLFLLSTGDDKYLPRVKEYIDHLAENIDDIGDHTWDNGYNGILSAEYYLRTGDETALPVLQYYCDNAKERQFFGVGWNHWGRTPNPRYVAGGLMNPAGAQVVTTLLLGKECGVDVDEETLIGALRQWYRFVGRGSVPYGDHRGEGGLGSNGKDGMTAAMMQAASGAQGNVEIYNRARDYLSMATLTSYPKLVQGHGDRGRGDGIWRGIASAYSLDTQPNEYHALMHRLRWWFDLSRRPAGGIGMAMNDRFDDVGSGAGLALAYTAPLKTLRITGAPRSKHAKSFTLPEHLWGREADLAFHSVEHGEPYRDYGDDEPPIHVLLEILGDAYRGPDLDFDTASRNKILQNIYHKRYMIRAQAGKVLLRMGALDELEKLLEDNDPRVRRAALDGLTDYRYWHAMGRNPITSEQFTPAMIAAIRKMLADPEESVYVVDGALMALSRASSQEIMDSLRYILPWTMHNEWWLRQSSFRALAGIAREETLMPEVLPVMTQMMINEPRTQARQGMQHAIASLLRQHPVDSLIGEQAFAGLQRAVKETAIKSQPRSGEGQYYVVQAALTSIQQAPAEALSTAESFRGRFSEVRIQDIATVADNLIEVRNDLPEDDAEALKTLLYGDYRRVLIQSLEQDKHGAPLNTILALTQLENPDADWRVVGRADPAEQIWHFTSFDPKPEDELHPRHGRRFRDVELPEELEDWYLPEYDAAEWETGRAPIGKGVFEQRGTRIENRTPWGDGEFLVMRSTFEADPQEYDFYRLRVLANQGFRIYLNGHAIHTYIWWRDDPHYRPIGLGPDAAEHLQNGTNHLAIYANATYRDGEQVAQIDAYLEGLKEEDLVGKQE